MSVPSLRWMAKSIKHRHKWIIRILRKFFEKSFVITVNLRGEELLSRSLARLGPQRPACRVRNLEKV